MCFLYFRSIANTLRDPERPEDFNQDMMVLSITPNEPQCS